MEAVIDEVRSYRVLSPTHCPECGNEVLGVDRLTWAGEEPPSRFQLCGHVASRYTAVVNHANGSEEYVIKVGRIND